MYIPHRRAFVIGCLFLLLSFNAFAQVGIGTTDPKTVLDVDGALSLREGTALSLGNADNNNISLGTTPYSLYRITGPTAAFSITGLTPLTGADGQIVTLENTTTHTMTIVHDATSTAANRIYCPGANNFVLVGQYATVTLQYNSSQSRWVIINYADKRYGDNIQSSVGTSDISTTSTSYEDMTDMSITFIPKHSTVYVTFSAAGHLDIGATNPAYAEFQLVNVTSGSVTITGTSVMTSDFYRNGGIGSGFELSTSWNAQIAMYPVAVTPGTSTTLKMQWRRIFVSGNNGIELYNSASALRDSSHRVLTILD